MTTHELHYRQGTADDIAGMTLVRLAVRENRLPDPTWLTHQMWLDGLLESGNANTFVCERDGRIVGFSIGRVREADIWALFVDPPSEGLGIGKRLLAMVSDWMFDQGVKEISLGTGVQTRAEMFYRLQGWRADGLSPKGEQVYRLSRANCSEETAA
ncbi:MAG: GNAT family N-acetyltransferase [Dokdonella sp.]